MVTNPRYPCSFKITKETPVEGEDPVFGSTTTEDVLSGKCSLQDGKLVNEDIADTYDWIIYYDASTTPLSQITNSCDIEVVDQDGNVINGGVRRVFNSTIGRQIWFNETNK